MWRSGSHPAPARFATRGEGPGDPPRFATPFLSGSLREEGRLAALAGDRDGAIKAYRWYLTLVADPEPSLVPRRDSVRAELAKLERKR
jgi:hypothetical protein